MHDAAQTLHALQLEQRALLRVLDEAQKARQHHVEVVVQRRHDAQQTVHDLRRRLLLHRLVAQDRQHARQHVHQVQLELAVEAGAAGADEAKNLLLVGGPEGLHRLQDVGQVAADVLLHDLHQVHQKVHDALEVRRVALLALHRADERRDDERQVGGGATREEMWRGQTCCSFD